MRVTTDGVLLGAWTNANQARQILDVGTGTGLIAIMLAQRTSAFIDAIEIDKMACTQAMENVEACPWPDRINIIHCDFRDFARNTDKQYDIVVSNPPFFRSSLKPPAWQRSVARHDGHLSYEAIFHFSARLLAPYGSLFIISPAIATQELTDMAYLKGLHLKTLLRVSPSPHKPVSRCMFEFTLTSQRHVNQSEMSVRKSDGKTYSDEYREMTREYYLK
jgi:tRNA1Val (adenine37-N6)-methyltransferase